MASLTLQGVSRSFGSVEVIRSVDLDVADGEFVVLVGPSGCGKSTLLRMIAGLEEVTAGRIGIDGRTVNALPPVQRGVSMVFQSYALYPHMTVFENIAFPLRVERRPRPEVDRRVREAAAILKLADRLFHKPGQLSGGQRQRVAIGRAIVRKPGIFLFDEPLSNLDAALRGEMRVELVKLHHDLGATMIYVTHDQVEAMTMADRIVVLNAGVAAQVGSPLELYHQPSDMVVAGFIGNPKMNFIPVTCTGIGADGVQIGLGDNPPFTVPVTPAGEIGVGQRLTLGLRPEHVLLNNGAFRLGLRPHVVEQLGIHTISYARPPGQDDGLFCCLSPGNAAIRVNREILVGARAADCHLFDARGRALPRRTPS